MLGFPDERPTEAVAAVAFEGTTAFDAKTLSEGLANHPPRGLLITAIAGFDPIALHLDRKRLETWYRDRGWLEAEVVDVEIERRDNGDVLLIFHIDEGARYRVSELRIEGAPETPGARAIDLRRAAELRRGEVVDYDAYESALGRVESQLQAMGHATARVKGRIEAVKGTARARVVITVSAGPRARFGETRVVTGERLPESLVRNRLAWAPGDTYDPVRIERTRGRLYSTGLLRGARIDWRPRAEDPRTLDLEVQLDEGRRNEVILGGGVGIEPVHYELRLRATYQRRSFLDPLLTLRMSAEPGYAFFRNADGGAFNIDARLSLKRADFIWPRWELDGGVAYGRIQLEAFTTQGPSTWIGLGHPMLDDRLNLGLSLHFRELFIEHDLASGAAEDFGITDALTLAFVQTRLSYDARDDAGRPRLGFYLRLELDSGYSSSSNDIFARVTPEARAYLPMGSRFTWAARFRLGTRLTPDPLPATLRYFAGGGDSQRGFGNRRLSPRAPRKNGRGAPAGADASATATLELRTDLFRLFGSWFGIANFVDVADVASDIDDLAWDAPHLAVGGGLRYRTPLGALRLDFGWRLNRKGPDDPDDNSPWAIHFSIGEAF